MLSNPQATKEELISWIQRYFEQNGKDCSAVIGISGGKDSTIAAALCAAALGKERVVGVLMPNGEQRDLSDSYRVTEHLGIRHRLVNIASAVSAVTQELEKSLPVSEQAKINLPPRIRMSVLYAVAQSLPEGGRVVNTCNLSEDFVGYSTKFGDSAGDFSPLANLTVQEVKQIGYTLDIPRSLVAKPPADGLCGKSDEENLGFSYSQLDEFIRSGHSQSPIVDKRIRELHRLNRHKLEPMPAFIPR